MRVQAQMTQEHIDKGLVCNARFCPVALMLTEATGMVASVGRQIYLVNDDEHITYRIETPDEVTQFIRDFDAKIEVKPIAVSLNMRRVKE